MMWRFPVVALIVLCSGCVCAEVYRWTDENGAVAYGERPPPGRGEAVKLRRSGGGKDVATPDAAARKLRRQRLLESYDYQRQRKKEQKAKQAQDDANRARTCRRLQRHWRQYSFPGPIYFSDGHGGRRYVDDDERKAKQAQLRPLYRKACGENPE